MSSSQKKYKVKKKKNNFYNEKNSCVNQQLLLERERDISQRSSYNCKKLHDMARERCNNFIALLIRHKKISHNSFCIK